jgi:hypothetical protein
MPAEEGKAKVGVMRLKWLAKLSAPFIPQRHDQDLRFGKIQRPHTSDPSYKSRIAIEYLKPNKNKQQYPICKNCEELPLLFKRNQIFLSIR